MHLVNIDVNLCTLVFLYISVTKKQSYLLAASISAVFEKTFACRLNINSHFFHIVHLLRPFAVWNVYRLDSVFLLKKEMKNEALFKVRSLFAIFTAMLENDFEKMFYFLHRRKNSNIIIP